MSEMRESNISWIGKIPCEWSINRLRYVCDMKTGGTPDDKYGINMDMDGYPWITAQDMNETYKIQEYSQYIDQEAVKRCKYKLFPSKSILLVCIASVGKLGMIKEEAYSNQQITALMSNNLVNAEYLLYYIQSINHKIVADASSSVVPIVNTAYLKDIVCLLPLKKEQELISTFLDDKIEKIDNILKRLNKQIEILIKYKESIINESLTSNSYKTIQATNIDKYSFGGWKEGRIKDVISILTDYTANGSFQDLANNVEYLDYESYARLVRLTDLRENLENPGIYVNEDSYKYLKKSSLYGNEVLVANVGAYAGLFCIMPKVNMPATLGPNMYLLKTNNLMLNKYLYYLGNAKYVSEQLIMKATSSAQPKLNKEDVKTIKILIPPVEEQQKIVDYLDKKCEEIDVLIKDKQQQIEKMKQYKKSLIYEYVTGKRRVKGAEELYG